MRISYKNKIIISLLAIGGALLLPFSVKITTHQQTLADTHTPTTIQTAQGISTPATDLSISRNVASAASGDVAGTNTTNVELAVAMEGFLKVVYILLWPLLWLAGQAMDNSLIYGEFIGIDSALFKFRSIMKNFANFALGFMFLRSIISYVLNPSEKKHPKDMIVKLLLAGLGVQVSWFAVGAMVDLSTALTVGIGGLPLQFMDQAQGGNDYVFGIKTTLKLNDAIGSNDSTPIAYTLPGSNVTQGSYILPCYFTGGKIVWDQSARGNAFGVGQPGGNNLARATDVTPEYCIRANKPISKDVYEKACKDKPSCPLYIGGDTKSLEIISGSLDVFKTKFCDNSAPCQTMQTIAKKSEGYQSAFYSLYSSLLNLATIHIGVPKTDASIVMETLIKTVVGLAYLIPLAVLCVILIMRVGYLWLVIAFSPFIALSSVKDLMGGKLKDGLEIGGIKTKFNISNVVSLLLLPVVVTFAISMSIVFLSSLSNGLTSQSTAESIGVYSRMEGNYKCYDVAVTDICIDMPSKDIGSGIFDYFGWLIMNFFGIGLMWFVVMAALKSAEFTKGIADKVSGLASSALMNAPIIPVGGGGKRTSLGGVKNLGDQVSNQMSNAGVKNTQVLSEYLEGKKDKIMNKDAAGTKVLNAATTTLQGKSNDLQAARSALNTVKADPGFAHNKLDFGEYDGSTAFANNLAVAAGFPATTFSKGGDLFTTKEGKEVLARLAPGHADAFMDDTLRRLYSNKNDVDTDAAREKIKSDVIEIQKAKYPDAQHSYKISSDGTSLFQRNTTDGSEKPMFSKTNKLDRFKTKSKKDIEDIIATFAAVPRELQVQHRDILTSFAGTPGQKKEITLNDNKTYIIETTDPATTNSQAVITITEKTTTTTTTQTNTAPRPTSPTPSTPAASQTPTNTSTTNTGGTTNSGTTGGSNTTPPTTPTP